MTGSAAVLVALATVAAVVVVAAWWVARNPHDVREALRRQLTRPAAARLRGTYERGRAFVDARLDPQRTFGLSVTVAVVVLVLLGWTFGVIAEDVLDREGVAEVDSPVTAWLADNRLDWLTPVMHAVSRVGSTALIAPLLALVSAVVVVRTRRWRVPVFLLLAAAGTSALITVIKLLVARSRPDVGYTVQTLEGTAFPSGHTAQTVAAYGALAYLAGRAWNRWGVRVAAWAAVALLALTVGFSRLYLGAHWLSDVLAGYALGAAWLAVVIGAMGTHRRIRLERATADPPRSQP